MSERQRELESRLDQAAEAIAGADALLITAGAGMGVDSGLPDFRGSEGFWRAYPPIARLGLRFDEMANPVQFAHDPALAWGFYGHRLALYRATRPHRGFDLLRRWAERKPRGAFVFTSNVDGQFQRAGFSPDRVVECHGSMLYLQCAAPCSDELWGVGGLEVAVDETTFRARPPLPTCLACGSTARPNVLMFGDWLWVPRRTAVQEERFRTWLDRLEGPPAVVEIGAGTAVPTVRLTSEHLAREHGGRLVRINPREPRVPAGGVGLELGALEALEALELRLAGCEAQRRA